MREKREEIASQLSWEEEDGKYFLKWKEKILKRQMYSQTKKKVFRQTLVRNGFLTISYYVKIVQNGSFIDLKIE